MTTKPQSSERQPMADDRNIVSLDSSYEGAGFEDRVFLFWHNYKTIIIGACVVLVLALVGWGLIELGMAKRDARIAAEYQEAVSIPEITAFAEKHAPLPLAGAAFLRVADYHFENGDYSEAAGYYGKAGGILPPVLAGRAKIGQGIALAHAGDEAAALAQMEKTGGDASLLRSTRAEAYYHAATLAFDVEGPEAVRNLIGKIAEFDDSQLWVNRARGLEQALPEPAAETESADQG